MNYKLLCLDMDGTLLDEQGTVSQENKEAVLTAWHTGMMIALATGRGVNSAEYYLDFIGIDGGIVALNGACIKQTGSAEILFKCSLSLQETEAIWEVIDRCGVRAYFSTQDATFTNKNLTAEMLMRRHGQGATPLVFYSKRRLKNVLKKLAGKMLKISIVMESDRDNFLQAEKQLRDLETFEVVRSDTNYVEVMKKGCSKGNGIKLLANYLGIKREEIVCIGDNENDVSMIKYAGLGIAMGNGCLLAKQEAAFVTDDNIQHGVAKAIHEILID